MSRPRLSRAVVTATISALLTSTLFAMPAAADQLPEPTVDNTVRTAPEKQPSDRFIVKFKETAGTAATRGKAYGVTAKDLGVSVKELRTISTGASVVSTDRELDAAEAEEFIAALEADPAVEYAEADTPVFAAAAAPNDAYFDYQWDLTQKPYGLDVLPAWDTTTGTGSVVAVIDTGVLPHADLDANMLPGYDMISDTTIARDGGGRDANPRDEGDYGDGINCPAGSSSWHGSHVAGTIAAVTGNGIGIAGVAPGAKVLPIRALGLCGGGWSSDIIDGITWASGGPVTGVPANPNPARVINLSLSGNNWCSTSYQTAIDAAVARGSVIVAAAGNEGDDATFYAPANCNNVITVGASGPDGAGTYYSNFGDPLDVSAPGGDSQYGAEGLILSTVNTGTQTPITGGDEYGFMQGTSMAAPHVAGVVALMLSANPSLTPAKVEELLKGTTKPFVSPTIYSYGTGIAYAPDAVAAAVLGEVPPPVQYVTPGDVYMDGELRVGSTLTARTAYWDPAPLTFSYEWFIGNSATPAATTQQYTLRTADLGQVVTLVVTGSKDGYESASSELVSPSPVAYETLTAGTPTISGTGTVGETLTVSDGTWGPSPVTLTRQWLRNGSVISGATGTSYTLVAADAGTNVSVRVTGTKTGYTSSTQTSAAKAIQGASFTAPTPTINGTVKVGSTLTASSAVWTPVPATMAYAWLRNGTPISGATSPSYTLTPADLDATIQVRFTGSRTGYITQSATSAATAPVAEGTLTAPTPTISGTAKAGSTLTAAPGTWTAGTTLAYQWLRDGTPISGATASTYSLTADDTGTNISVTVTGSKPGYTTVSRTSSATPVSNTATKPVSNDFNGDGTSDVLARDTAGKLWLYAGNGKGGWLGRTQVGSGWGGFTSILTPGDFDGDGNPDVLGRDSRGGYWLYPGNGDSGWKFRVKVGSGWQGFTALTAPGDFNGDGNVDVLARDSRGGFHLYPGNGTGGWKSRVTVGSGWNGFTSILGPGDFNGDGAVDVLARHTTGALYLYAGNGTGGWKSGAKIGSGWQGFTALVTPGDFNGDGTVDVLARDRYGVLWLYGGNGSGGWTPRAKAGSGWNIMNSIS